MASWTVYLVGFILCLIAYLYNRREKRKLPPGDSTSSQKTSQFKKTDLLIMPIIGPWAWPILGNSLDMKPFIFTATSKYAKKYGDIATMYFGMDR